MPTCSKKSNPLIFGKTSGVRHACFLSTNRTDCEHPVNLGRWVLRYLFASLVDEELRRDAAFRATLASAPQPRYDRSQPPSMIQLPQAAFLSGDASSSVATPRASRNPFRPMPTPGMTVSVATPGNALLSPSLPSGSHASGTANDERELTRNTPRTLPGAAKKSLERTAGVPPSAFDYFSARAVGSGSGSGSAIAETPGSTLSRVVPMTPSDAGGDGSAVGSFGKRLRMSFTNKVKTTVVQRPVVPETPKSVPAPLVEGQRPSEEGSVGNKSVDGRVFEDSFRGVVQRLRAEYADAQVNSNSDGASAEGVADGKTGPQQPPTLLTPALPLEAPVLKPPAATRIIIQEDAPEMAGVTDLFEGDLSSLGRQADMIEEVAPAWLADVLLRVWSDCDRVRAWSLSSSILI